MIHVGYCVCFSSVQLASSSSSAMHVQMLSVVHLDSTADGQIIKTRSACSENCYPRKIGLVFSYL
jgi:hypothetical protein